MYQHLLVPVDGSEIAARAMRVSIDLARKLGASITGFIVEPPAPPPPPGQRPVRYLDTLEQHERRIAAHAHEVLADFEAHARAAGVPFQGRSACTGLVEEAIVEVAQREGCDLIVMVTHGRHGWSELLHGSHTKGVLARSRLPLLVLH